MNFKGAIITLCVMIVGFIIMTTGLVLNMKTEGYENIATVLTGIGALTMAGAIIALLGFGILPIVVRRARSGYYSDDYLLNIYVSKNKDYGYEMHNMYRKLGITPVDRIVDMYPNNKKIIKYYDNQRKTEAEYSFDGYEVIDSRLVGRWTFFTIAYNNYTISLYVGKERYGFMILNENDLAMREEINNWEKGKISAFTAREKKIYDFLCSITEDNRKFTRDKMFKQSFESIMKELKEELEKRIMGDNCGK